MILLCSALLNLFSWKWRGFSDWFRKYIFPLSRYIMGHFSSLFSKSLGELMLVAAVILVLVWILLAVFIASNSLILWAKSKGLRKKGAAQNHGLCQKAGKLFKRYNIFLSWVLSIVCLIMTTNCFVLYHCSDFETLYLEVEEDKEYTVADLIRVRDEVINKANQLAPQMKRDAQGNLVYEADLWNEQVENQQGDWEKEQQEKMEQKAIQEMKRLGERYPLLSGYDTNPKIFRMSKFFSQQYMMGYYFPFSMEANYNGMMYVSNMPPTICHELSHIQGFMFEDDANFIGYLACITSDDPFFQYCGYLSVIDYLNADLFENLDYSVEAYLSYRQCNELVQRDNIFLTKEAWDEVEKSAVLDTETVRKASDKFLDTNLNLNGVEEGVASYGRVVELLLKYDDESRNNH